MNAIPSTVISIACPTQPGSELHSVMIMVDLNLSPSPTCFAFWWHYMICPKESAEFLVIV